VVQEEGDFFGLFVNGLMSLPSVVVVPDPDEVFQLDPVIEGRGGGVLPLSATETSLTLLMLIRQIHQL
jgi:hypothetical protein